MLLGDGVARRHPRLWLIRRIQGRRECNLPLQSDALAWLAHADRAPAGRRALALRFASGMQRWLFTIAMLLMAGSAAATVDLPVASSHPHHANSGWRRTTRGWEHSSAWSAPQPSPISRLSPVVVGALQVLISVGAILALDEKR
jgi:hypothetical protein